ERVEDDVHSEAARRAQEVRLELAGARGSDVIVVEAMRAQRWPLARARGREDLCAEVARELDSRHPDTTGGGVDEQAFPGADESEADERVVGREKDDGQSGAFDE